MKKYIHILVFFILSFTFCCFAQDIEKNDRQFISEKPPYPFSTFITDVMFAPDSTIIRQAKGGDNWPITWGDDNLLYTTYGDGYGFKPKIKQKLSIGYAKISGTPPNHLGSNIRNNGELLGQGRSGEKGIGIIMVDSVIYIWLMHADRNGGQSRLAWSDDHLQTVKFVDWVFPDFGICSFINFGKNNAWARDDYVYTVTHDSPKPDVPADRFILMRVKKDKILYREKYEFFVKNDINGNPVWTDDIEKRGAVFENPNACLRHSITYNAGLERYLWWQQIPNYNHKNNDLGDTRFTGGFGIYEAPESWGPWRTVYFTEKWDVGPGELANFPAKWMSKDGKTCYMTFSGDDSFSVRKMVFKTHNE